MAKRNDAQTSSMLKVVGYTLLIVATVAGAWALAVTLRDGHYYSATTQFVPWGLWVALYIFFLGLSAGSFLLSTLVYVFGVKRLEAVGPMALVQALGCLILGGILILLDLGHPFRVYKVLAGFNVTSVMAWMGLFYNLYILVILLELYLALRPTFVDMVRRGQGPVGLYRTLTFGYEDISEAALARDRRWLRILGTLGIPIAVIVHGGVGTIFAVAKARPTWFGGAFPILFLLSALASGGALLTLLTAAFVKLPRDRRQEIVVSLSRLTVGILAFELLFLFAEVLTSLYGDIPHEAGAWRITLFGPFWWVFWIFQLGLGAIVPILIVAHPRTGRRVGWLAAAGALIVIGMVAARLSIVVPNQVIPPFEAMVGAYNGPRFSLGYFPSAHEWLVGLGVAALGVWMFIAVEKLLPVVTKPLEAVPEGGN
ncbi:MAG: molybdopterin oxidoreductase [Candidatus Dadabacteria bacterium]|nr:MAG: molybdopterin oxidoreductase [Candidatus Dadabacteria bacterium]